MVVGTGFASSFFLSEYLKHAGADARVLVLERGPHDTYAWQLKNRKPSSTPIGETRHEWQTKLGSGETQGALYTRQGDPGKRWVFSVGFGGGSNCWWGGTPRMMPGDFEMKSRYGVSRDWPISYNDLEPYYQRAEEAMQIAGPDDGTPFPRSKPYPQPPHRMSLPDQMLKKGHPGQYIVQPSARASVPTKGRGVCCGNGICFVCPVNAKFTIQNSMAHLYKDPRVVLRLKAAVDSLETKAGVVSGVRYRYEGRDQQASGDLVVLGANAIYNPFIMLRSGMTDPLLGRRLHEQVSFSVDVDLDGVDNFGGSSVITGLGYMFYEGDHRRDHAACMVESWNRPNMLRHEKGKWRQLTQYRLVFDDLPSDENRVKLDASAPERPIVYYKEFSSYARRGMEILKTQFAERFLKPLPVERFDIRPEITSTENHILGTTVMGNDAADSVLDRHLVHHRFRNLVVLGAGAFPHGSPANPSLTVSALSLWSAAHVLGAKQ